MSRFARLSPADRSNLYIERPETPAHIAGLCLLDAAGLPFREGRLDLDAVRERLARRLPRVAVLRRRVYRPPLLGGPPLWVDDAGFDIAKHVRELAVPAPGGESELLEAAARLFEHRLDRSRPLWELWFLTGLANGAVGLLFKVQHAVADGLAGVALMSALFDLDPAAPDPMAAAWRPEPVPAWRDLLLDNLADRAAALLAPLRHPLSSLAGAVRAARDGAGFLREWEGAARTSLNGAPGRERVLRTFELGLEEVREVAHRHGGKVNDAVLAVVTAGLREVVIGRGEMVPGLELRTSVPAALRDAAAARELGNTAGAMLVPLPVSETSPGRALERIARATRLAKERQHPAYVGELMGFLAGVGLAVPMARHQRLVNLFVTNVPGPQQPLYVLGSRIRAVLPILGLAGNVTVMFAALSYCGRLAITVNADRGRWPDIDRLVAGMQAGWAELRSAGAPAPRADPAAVS